MAIARPCVPVARARDGGGGGNNKNKIRDVCMYRERVCGVMEKLAYISGRRDNNGRAGREASIPHGGSIADAIRRLPVNLRPPSSLRNAVKFTLASFICFGVD